MDKREALIEVGKRVAPILSEFGLESYVLTGYIRTEERLERFVAVFAPRDNPAMADGLGQLISFSTIWAAPALHEEPPEPPNSDEKKA